MPAGEQVALQPALAVVLGQDLHHPAVAGQVLVDVGSIGSSQVLPVTSNTASSRLEAVSSGPNRRKLRGAAFGRDHVAQHRAQDPGRLGSRRARASSTGTA